MIGETGEALTFYCIHEADAYGTNIYEALQRAAQARAGRAVQIVNLGLEPAEAIGMGLQVESVTRKSDNVAPVAGYVSPEWDDWLHSNRVELNAMTTPQFLAWLDRKFADAMGKVVPPMPVLSERLEADVRASLTGEITREILADADLAGRVDAAILQRRAAMTHRIATLADEIQAELDEEPAENWREPVYRAAAEIARAV